jgi:phosphoribosylamine--glycine ligase
MNILIVGNGGREHALAWKIRQSKLCANLYVAPGNAGTSLLAKNLPISAEDFVSLGDFCIDNEIDLVIVGPEVPLVKGIRDYFESHDKLRRIAFVGPGKLGAQLEGSKDFSKQFMLRHGIPTAKAKVFGVAQLTEALDYISTCKPPIVLKADGLAAGKGVIISLTQREARDEIRDMLLNKKFGEASAKILVEEFLTGIELSVFVLTDGEDYLILPEAKDYKRIGDGDTGLNTGGMGAVSPVVFANESFLKKVDERIVKPTIQGLKKEGIPYKGFIFIGLMNMGGNPYVIEYNVRMGDPETQAVMPRIKSDLVELMKATAEGELRNIKLEIDEQHAVSVVMVSGGYPNTFDKGKVVHGLGSETQALVFHAGTKMNSHEIVTDGGRVLAITGMGQSLEKARVNAYGGVSHISWENSYFRKDIGLDLLKLT